MSPRLLSPAVSIPLDRWPSVVGCSRAEHLAALDQEDLFACGTREKCLALLSLSIRYVLLWYSSKQVISLAAVLCTESM